MALNDPDPNAWSVSVASAPETLASGGKASFAVTLTNTADTKEPLEFSLYLPFHPTWDSWDGALFDEITDSDVAKLSKAVLQGIDKSAFAGDPTTATKGWSDDLQKGSLAYVFKSAPGKLFDSQDSFSFVIPASDLLKVSTPKSPTSAVMGGFFSHYMKPLRPAFRLKFRRDTSTESITSDPPGGGNETPLLSWTAGDGNPLNAGSKGLVQIQGQNLSKDNISASKVTVTLPAGRGEKYLCTKDNLPKDAKNIQAPQDWKVKTPLDDSGNYVFVPVVGQTVTVKAGEGVEFRFKDIQIDNTPGEVKLHVSEMAKSAKVKKLSRSAQAPLTKYAATFYFDYFVPTLPAIRNGETATLRWSAKNATSYQILSDDPHVSKPTPQDTTAQTGKLQMTGGYVLDASDGHQTFRRQAVVEVYNQSMTLHDVTILDELTLEDCAYTFKQLEWGDLPDGPDGSKQVADTDTGDRFVLLGVHQANTDEGALKVCTAKDGHITQPPLDTLRLDKTDSPVGVHVPAGHKLVVQYSAASTGQEAEGLSINFDFAITSPRILPPPPPPLTDTAGPSQAAAGTDA
ncbi:hypothetical protein [Streptomyces sp. S186]|uniref:hypothetical protein n=1 Tax=Streptomyces sp. S186 TaxID=3434395 RepID=UPI003F672397